MAQMIGPTPILRKGQWVPATVAFDVELDELEFLAGLGFVVSSVEETVTETAESTEETATEADSSEGETESETAEEESAKDDAPAAKEAVSKEKPASALSKASKA